MLTLTVIGHACSMIHAGNKAILCDSHFFDSYSGGLFTYHPGRSLQLKGLPKPDLVYVSHRHRDHFDARSLALLDRGTPVLCPKDAEILYVLQKLHFSDVNPVEDWTQLRFGEAQLIVTPSLYRVPEHGLLIATEDGVLWNMVDTVIDAEIVAHAQRLLRGRPIDILLWPYQPLKETDAAENLDLAFPVAQFERELAVLRTVAPRYTVPYSDGQFGIGPTAWLNHYRFPVSPAELRDAVAKTVPGTELVELVPGDQVCLDDGRLHSLPLAAFVQVSESDPEERAFNATASLPSLASLDMGSLGVPRRSWEEIASSVRERWRQLLANADLSPFLLTATRWNVYYDLIVELQGGREATFRFHCPNPDPELLSGAPLTEAPGRAVIRIPVGVLDRLLDGRLHFVAAYLGGLFRSWEAIFRVNPFGLQRPVLYQDRQTVGAAPGSMVLSPAMFLNALLAQDPYLSQRILDHELGAIVG